MKIMTRKARVEAWVEADDNWHRWFAWFPVRIEDGYYWLQFIERRRIGSWVHASFWSNGGYVKDHRVRLEVKQS